MKSAGTGRGVPQVPLRLYAKPTYKVTSRPVPRTDARPPAARPALAPSFRGAAPSEGTHAYSPRGATVASSLSSCSLPDP